MILVIYKVHIPLHKLSCLNNYFKSKDVKCYTKRSFLAIQIIIILLFSSFYTKYRLDKYHYLYKNVNNTDIEITAVIISNPQIKEYNTIYKIKVINKKYKNTKLLLYIKNTKNLTLPELKYGDMINISGKFNLPTTQRNYKGFDYSKYLYSQNIYGTIKANNYNIKIVKENCTNTLFRLSNNISYVISYNSKQILTEPKSSILTGILIGDTTDIPPDIEDYFKISGLTHILAVSGSHVAYIILFMTFIFNNLKFKKTFSYFLFIFGIIMFMLISGSSASVVRASIMGIIMIFSKITYRKLDIINSLFFSLLLILIFNPLSVFDIGLPLSFLGTLGIIVFYKDISEFLKYKIKHSNKMIFLLIESFSLTVSAQLLIIPIMIINFNTVSTISIISNVFAGPLSVIIIISGIILIIISIISIKISLIFSWVISLFISSFIKIAQLFSTVPYATILVNTPHTFIIILYYFTILYIKMVGLKNIFYNIKNSLFFKKVIITILILCIFLAKFTNIDSNHYLKIYFIDIGQGDSTLIVSGNKKILIDGGGNLNTEIFDVGKNTVIPYLLARKVKKLDYILISHFDADHCNGLIAVLENLKVNIVIFSKQTEITQEYENIIKIIKQKNIKIQIVQAGDKIVLDKYTYLDILYPDFKLIEKDLNNNSIVTKLNYYNFSMLFTRRYRSTSRKTPG